MKRLLLLIIPFVPAAADEVLLECRSPRDAAVEAKLRVDHLAVDTIMRGLLAETRATFTLSTNAGASTLMEGRMEFELPEGCTVTGAALDVQGTMRSASVTRPRTARLAYDSVVSRMLDPCLVQLLPQGRVRVQVFPFSQGKPRQLRLEFAQLLKPGGVWELPFTLPEPVLASVTVDPPPAAAISDRIRGGREVMASAPDSAPGQPLAHPDGAGRWRFQLPLPQGERLAAPGHLLIVADVSLLQSGRDFAAERAALTELFRSMQSGRVTLTTFSTSQHGTAEFEVSGGTCEPALRALDDAAFDGAPRPGVVDASGISADLTVVLSTLTTPAGGSARPKLPSNAPVWIMDSVSPEPGADARRLAAETGGYAFHPSRRPDLYLTKRRTVSGQHFEGLQHHALPGGSILLTGELTTDESELILDGHPVKVRRGTDAAAGRLISQLSARAGFMRHAASLPAWRPANLAGVLPVLTEDAAFIVLEEYRHYTTFGIPLPPDLTPESNEAPALRSFGMEIFDRELDRAHGTKGNDSSWLARLADYNKMQRWHARIASLGEFQALRGSAEEGGPGPPWFRQQPWWPQLQQWRSQRARELPLLARRYADSPASEQPALIQKARELQGTRAAEVPLMESTLGPIYSSGDAHFDVLRAAEWDFTRSGGMEPDPFAGAADSFAGAVDPFAGSGLGSSANPLLPASVPPGPEAIPQKRRKPLTLPDSSQILSRASSLLEQNRRAEAIRALSCLALNGQDSAGSLFLLAWKFEEWNEPGLAREVLEHLRHTHGHDEAVAYDLARLAQAAGHTAEAVRQFSAAKHDAALRDLAALEGRQSAALRVVMECAGPGIDADLEVEGPDFELCSPENPLPAFGGALSFDARGPEPEDFVLPAAPDAALTIQVRLPAGRAVPVRVTIIHEWGRPGETRRTILLPAAGAGVTVVTRVEPAR